MSEKLKITLTTQALERLIGGDTEIEIELRQGVAAEFAKRHLKGLVTDEVTAECNRLKAVLLTTVQQELARILKERGFPLHGNMWGDTLGKSRVTLPEAAVKVIEEMVDRAFQDRVSQKIVAMMAAELTDERIAKRIDHNVAMRVAAEVKARVNDILTKAQQQ